MDARSLNSLRVTLCVDALEPQLGGIGRYTWELCKRLSERDDISELRFFARNRLIEDPAQLLRGEPVRRGRKLMRLYFDWRARQALGSTLVHGPNYFLPAAAQTGVITVHDLSVFLYPEMHPPERVRAFERQFTSSLNRAAHVITDSETVRSELLEAFAIASEKVTAVRLGVDERFRPRDREDLRAPLSKLGLEPQRYGLCVSTLEPRKKIGQLIGAWRLLPPACRSRYPLVLVGGSGWLNEELHAQIRKATDEGWLRILGFVEDETLPRLYAGAELFIYPSIYEGFGLPPVEAMASGVPVIVANRSCLPEVCGEAARYVEPDDVNAFAAAIEASLLDGAWRSDARRLGLDRARSFTWDRCIEDTVAVYHKVTDHL